MSEEQARKIPEIRLPTEAEMRESRRNHLLRIQNNKTCMSYWYPLVPADVPTPPTILVEFPYEVQMSILNLAEDDEVSEEEKKEIDRGISKIEEACDLFGYPCFIKTGIFSDKHNWTCHVENKASVKQAVVMIVYNWACVGGMGGDDTNWFAVRKLIPTKPYMLFDGKMPVTKERRYFAEDGKVTRHQPYWPREAFPEWAKVDLLGHESIESALALLNEETEEEVLYLSKLARSVSKAIPGAWSMDFLQDVDGKWWLIDMAEAHKSYVDKTYEGAEKWLDDSDG